MDSSLSLKSFQNALLGKVLSALKILALEWKGEQRLQVMGDLPDWVEQEFEFVCLPGEEFSAETFSPFLNNFLVDAQGFWKENHGESLRSGIWCETRFSGHEIHLEAIALSLDPPSLHNSSLDGQPLDSKSLEAQSLEAQSLDARSLNSQLAGSPSTNGLLAEGQKIILIESSELIGSEKFQWLQTARQKQLSFIAERKVAEAKVLNATFYDSLTQLPNRSFFLAKLESFFEKSQWSEDRQFAIIVLNIDRFGLINTNIGTAAGDQVLMTIASRILSCLRKHDVPVRFGSDEFGVLVSHIDQDQDVVMLAQRLLESIHQPFVIEGQQTYFTASAGIALQQPWYQTSRDLLRDAGLAMQQAKSFGVGRYAIFQREMRSRAFELWSLESDLHSAIEQEQLQLWYQPIVDLTTHRIESFEALIRWFHPTHGWISPTKFIPLAEENGLILKIDSWVVRTACAAVKRWRLATGMDIQVNINISPQHFAQGDLVTVVQEALTTTEVAPNALRLEITESLLLNDTQKAIQTLTQLKTLGLEVAIDDFGTGYASLSYLQDLPLDKLKIDGYFIEMMDTNGSEIVNTIISLAHKLGFAVTAERVETVAQYETLQGLGCDTVQGHLFSRPVPINDAQQLIEAEFVISGQTVIDPPTENLPDQSA